MKIKNFFYGSRWLLSLLGFFLLLPAYAGDVYRCKGVDGNTSFQDYPCAGGDVPIVSWSGSRRQVTPMTGVSSSSQVLSKAETVLPLSSSGEKHFFWQAVAPGKPSLYLLGSIHFGRPEMYPLPKVVTAAFGDAKALLVELDALNVNPMVMAQSMASVGMFTDGRSLRDVLDAATWQRLTTISSSLGLPAGMVGSFKPWMAAMTLGALGVKKNGYREDLGIDMHFLKQATNRKLSIIELEGMDFQIAMMASLSLESQIVMLQDAIRFIEDGDKLYPRMLSAWQQGNPKALEALIKESFDGSAGAAELNRAMLMDRNITMVKKLAQLPGVNRDAYFVVVGAAHLVGQQGLVNLLVRKGYQVEQL